MIGGWAAWWRKPLTPLKPPETAQWAQEVMGMAPCLPSRLVLLYPEMAPPRDTQELTSKPSSPMRLRSSVDSPFERASAWASWWVAPQARWESRVGPNTQHTDGRRSPRTLRCQSLCQRPHCSSSLPCKWHSLQTHWMCPPPTGQSSTFFPE